MTLSVSPGGPSLQDDNGEEEEADSLLAQAESEEFDRLGAIAAAMAKG